MARSRPPGMPMATHLQSHRATPAPAAAGRRSRQPIGRFGPGRDVDEVHPPRPEGCPPPGGPRRRSGPASFVSGYNPSHERRPSLTWLRAVGRNRSTGARALAHARQRPRAARGVAARGRSGAGAPRFGRGAAAGCSRACDRGAGVASRPREPLSGARRAVRAPPSCLGCDPLPPRRRPRPMNRIPCTVAASLLITAGNSEFPPAQQPPPVDRGAGPN